jgi:Dolichyl-phosphate-mannose-protein mannosyltransferase
LSETRSGRREIWAGAGVLLVLLLGYMSLWWNRGIQLNSNGLPTLAAQQILAGKVPYRDFHFWCPPGHLLIYAGLAQMFGDGLIYVRAFATLERVSIFLLVYFWLARIYSARAAFFGTFVAAAGFSSDVGDVIAHYGFDAVLASVAAGFAASVAMTSRHRRARAMYFVAGICAGICMVFKQTQGVGVFLVLLVILTIGSGWREVLEYVAGWVIPTGLVTIWLARSGAWPAFIRQVFLQGTSSKGSMGEILLRPFFAMAHERMLAIAFVLAWGLMAAYAFLLRRMEQPRTREVNGAPWMLWLACTLALGIGFACAWFPPVAGRLGNSERPLIGYSAICIFIALYGNAVLALWYTFDALRGRLSGDELQKWILASLSAVTAYMFALSWAAFEQMLIPGFAYLMAMTLDRELRQRAGIRRWAVLALGFILVSTATFRKLTWPYHWENWVDGPIKRETAVMDFPEMRGLRVTPESAEFLRKVTAIIDAHSRPDETILCYPNYALFYVLAHRKPAVFAYMHWFDIVSDGLAREDAARIREHPPKVILYVDFPERDMRRLEISFRGGQRSGQRDLAATIESLPGYRVIETMPIPLVDYPLKIYGRE